ncbi:lipid-A-disaccharide synthase, partial [Oceaniglobus roseus]|uniref:lipid-A-disaccharide synthase n=1 Tax=Oceaniglobus roseus TaxID=1737570 RepID=UPI003CCC2F20
MRVFLIAGEPSGDRLGAALMAGLKGLADNVTFEGVGGPLMAEQGLASLFPMDELSVMGVAEILPKYFDLRRRLLQTVEAVLAARPDVLVTIDSPDFCLRVAARVRARARVRTVHYVAPSVWAWRPGRAAKMAPHVDQVLALLPFEPPYMEAAGMRCDFVGHPVVSEPVAGAADVAAFRASEGLGEAPVLLVLPGSRNSEVQRMLPVFGAAVARVLAARPD